MKAASHLWNLTFDIYNMKEVDKAGGPEEIAESRKISRVSNGDGTRIFSGIFARKGVGIHKLERWKGGRERTIC